MLEGRRSRRPSGQRYRRAGGDRPSGCPTDAGCRDQSRDSSLHRSVGEHGRASGPEVAEGALSVSSHLCRDVLAEQVGHGLGHWRCARRSPQRVGDGRSLGRATYGRRLRSPLETGVGAAEAAPATAPGALTTA